MTWTMDKHWQGLTAVAGAHMLAALIVTAPALVLLPDSAAAQATPAQQNAVRHYCRADFASKCPGVRAGEALICLEANLDDLSRNCKKAVLTALGVDSELEPVADAAPTPEPRAPSQTAPIVSTKPPGLNADAQRAKRRTPPVAATDKAADEPPPPKFATPRGGRTTHEADAAPDPLRPDSASADTAPPERAATSPSERADTVPPEEVDKLLSERTATLPPEEAVEPEPRSAAPARRTTSAPPRVTDPLVRACWNELVQNCRGMRPGGGRELACLTRHSRSLSPRCWDAYRTAWSRRR